MRTSVDFSRVLQDGTRSSDACFRVHACSSPTPNARLGVSVARKAVPPATARNRIKRQVRESFRLRRAVLPPVDIVVQVRAPAAHTNNAELRRSLEWHWQELIKRCAAP